MICNLLFPFFYYRYKKVQIISRLKLKTLQDVKDCYGEDNLIPIDFLPQLIFYTSKGVQPVYVCESEKEDKKGKIAYWFLKSETQWVYKKWNENRPVDGDLKSN